MRNKTDRNDGRGIAQVVCTGWLRFVHLKSSKSQELRLVLTHRKTLQQKTLAVDAHLLTVPSAGR